MSLVLWPHRNLNGADVVAVSDDWRYLNQPIGEAVDWQPGLDVALSCTIEIDVPSATHVLGFDPTQSCLLVVEWSSSSTRLRESCRAFPVEERMAVEVTLPGKRIGGLVTVRRRLVSGRQTPCRDEFAPTRAGTLLWDDRREFRVEGSGPQFPVIAAPFAAMGLDPSAIWTVRMPRPTDVIDVEAFSEPAGEFVCLLVNSDHPLAPALLDPSNTAGEIVAMRREINCRVARGIVDLGSSVEFGHQDFETGTLGALINSVAQRLGGGSAVELNMLEIGVLDALIQAEFGTTGASTP